MRRCGRGTFQAEGTASAKALKPDLVCFKEWQKTRMAEVKWSEGRSIEEGREL